MTGNPLQKFFRQPKLYISLPSKGMFYQPGSFSGDPTNVPVYAMTGMDEIIMKTPDALFNGEATRKVIESCCPSIKNARGLPSLDLDAILISIRIATFGDKMAITHDCTSCGTNNDFEIELTSILDHYKSKVYNNREMVSELNINLRPLNYDEMTHFNVENFKIQKTLAQLESLDETIRQEKIEEIYESLANTQVNIFSLCIESIQLPTGESVTEKEFIKEWLGSISSDDFNIIKSIIENNRTQWEVPVQTVKCASCEHEDKVTLTMDQSSFFGRG